ncbi:unnamed protein product [Phytomonas sp. EM1]|nr:unnamed protein product [Phytomonas sp. EM1]|eukprot:CCW63533.1 unnamed protein product [Phytomonas sp. isolate EM1]
MTATAEFLRQSCAENANLFTTSEYFEKIHTCLLRFHVNVREGCAHEHVFFIFKINRTCFKWLLGAHPPWQFKTRTYGRTYKLF